MEETEPTLDEFTFVQAGRTIVLPTIPTGQLARALNEEYCRVVEERFDNNPYLIADREDKGFTGSNLFKVLLTDESVERKGARVALQKDFDEQVCAMIKERHYTDSRAVVLRGTSKCYEMNLGIANALSEHVPNLNKPVLITGIRIEPWLEDEKGYKLKIVPTKEFVPTPDDRLSAKYNDWKFTEIDALGLPVGLRKNGEGRVWHTSNQRVSGLFLDYDLGLGCDESGLDVSYPNGQVVLVSDRHSARIVEGLLVSRLD